MNLFQGGKKSLDFLVAGRLFIPEYYYYHYYTFILTVYASNWCKRFFICKIQNICIFKWIWYLYKKRINHLSDFQYICSHTKAIVFLWKSQVLFSYHKCGCIIILNFGIFVFTYFFVQNWKGTMLKIINN